jgi:opacity protein-like surface antigen
MKKFLFAALSAFIFSTATTQAQTDNLSVSVLGGWSSHPDLMLGGVHTGVKDGYNLGARLGYKLDDFNLNGFSLDADYFYNEAGYRGSSGARLNSSSFMGNLIYHIPTQSQFSFYGGAGLGVVRDNLAGTRHGSSNLFGWQALGGAEYALNRDTSLFAEYRYQNAHDANVGGLTKVGNTSNNLSMGVRFTF